MEPIQLRLSRPELDGPLSRAYIRVEQYLCALRIHNKRIFSELTHAILEEVRRRLESGDTREPEAIAMDAVERHVENWYASLMGEGVPAEEPDRVRLSLFRADLANQWSRFFLRAGEIPPALKEEMRQQTLRTHPDAELDQRMQAEQLDLGKVGKWAEETWALFGKWPILGILTASAAYGLTIAFLIYFASL